VNAVRGPSRDDGHAGRHRERSESLLANHALTLVVLRSYRPAAGVSGIGLNTGVTPWFCARSLG